MILILFVSQSTKCINYNMYSTWWMAKWRKRELPMLTFLDFKVGDINRFDDIRHRLRKRHKDWSMWEDIWLWACRTTAWFRRINSSRWVQWRDFPASDYLWGAMSYPTVFKKTGKLCRCPGKQILVEWLQLKAPNPVFNTITMSPKTKLKVKCVLALITAKRLINVKQELICDENIKATPVQCLF